MYEEVVPGAADRIISMAEDQQRHRTDLETTALQLAREAQRGEATGQFVTLGVVSVSAAVAVVIAIIDPSWVVAVGAPAVAWVAGWAVRGMWRQPEIPEVSDDDGPGQ